MNAIKRSACWLAALALCATSCGQKDEMIMVLSDGYETAARTHRSFMNEPESLKVKLYHRPPDGKRVLVWPVVHSDVLIKDGVAVFVGDKTTGRSKLDNIWQMELRLFAAKAPGPPMDITSEVIGRWAKESGKDVTTAVKAASLLGAQINTNRLSCHFEFNGGVLAGADIILDWSQILEITREVKGKSVERKDPELRVIYLEKEFNAESQN